MMGSPATVITLAPTVTASGGGTLNGEGISFVTNDILDVWYKYGDGATLPSPPLESPHRIAYAVFAGTSFPGFQITKNCTDFSYQVTNYVMFIRWRRRGLSALYYAFEPCHWSPFRFLHLLTIRHVLRTRPLLVPRSVAHSRRSPQEDGRLLDMLSKDVALGC